MTDRDAPYGAACAAGLGAGIFVPLVLGRVSSAGVIAIDLFAVVLMLGTFSLLRWKNRQKETEP